ncbi:MAG: DUF4189 domain-containing protein [Potamolinea sp.]
MAKSLFQKSVSKVMVAAAISLPMVALASQSALAGYAVLAYSDSTGKYAWGRSTDLETAQVAAIYYCGVGDCKVMNYVNGQCAGFSLGTNGKQGWYVDENSKNALKKAVGLCTEYGGTKCDTFQIFACGDKLY